MFIYSYNENSEGARALARALKAKRIKHDKSSFIGAPKKLVLNWGATNVPSEVLKSTILNHPDVVRDVTDKLRFFERMRDAEDGPRIPRFTTDPQVAANWVAEEKKTVVARTILNSSGGKGIVLMEPENEEGFVEAPLYVEYIPKKDEYRIHFVKGEIIDGQRKALRTGILQHKYTWKIRNLSNGFVFIRGNVEIPEDVTRQAEKTIASLGLDFGAIDIIHNEKSNSAYVLEVNTAPGLQGETINSYTNALQKLDKESN